MSLGYEAFLKFDGIVALGTAATAPRQRPRLDSQGIYKGSIGGSGGMGYCHEYDYDSFDGSFGVELTPLIFDSIKPWIVNDRDEYKEIVIHARKNGYGSANAQRLDECYWKSITFDTSYNNAVTSSVEFLAWDKRLGAGSSQYNTISDNYINNRVGAMWEEFPTAISSAGSIPTLNAVYNTTPIPWYNCALSGFSIGSESQLLSISVQFSQVVEKVFLCQAQATAQEPAFVMIGPITGQVNTELFVYQGVYNVLDTINSVNLTIGSGVLSLGSIELQNFPDDLKDVSSQTSINLSYEIYGPLS